MSPFFNDLLPLASGQANLGVNRGTNANSFDITSIAPFLRVHCLSGIFHDPLRGESGVLRFNAQSGIFEISLNGGRSFIGIIGDLSQTLQTAYNNGPVLALLQQFGNLNILSKTSTISIATDGNRAPINISGLIAIPPQPFSNPNIGDIIMLTHSISSGTPLELKLLDINNVNAKSLGLGTLVLNTGSGLANISIGSGIAQFRSNSSVTLDISTLPSSGLGIGFDIQDFFDANYLIGETTTPKGFTVLSPGLYRITYNISLSKTAGTGSKISQTYLRRNLHETITYGQSFSYHHSIVNDKNTCYASVLVEANAGDFFTVFVNLVGTVVAGDITSTLQNDCWCIVEKVGSRRHEGLVAGI